MDPYLPTYEATPGESATDKWGNDAEDASSMLAAVHGEVGKTCMDSHVPQLGEQMTEGLEWATGNYDSLLGERTATQLLEARGIENSDEFCMNDSCHPYTRDDLEKKTAWMGEINPHTPQHGEQKCTTCHKAHPHQRELLYAVPHRRRGALTAGSTTPRASGSRESAATDAE